MSRKETRMLGYLCSSIFGGIAIGVLSAFLFNLWKILA
jgi:hypothetical protein